MRGERAEVAQEGCGKKPPGLLAIPLTEGQVMFPIGVCGDNCSYCPRYVATQNGSPNALEKVRELWVRLGLRAHDFPARDLACFGCRAENECAYSELCICASEKGFDNCGLCDGYPCKLVNDIFEKTEKLRFHAIRVCTSEEMDALHKAFFSKKQNLDQIHYEMNERKKKERRTAKSLHRIADKPGSR